MDIRALLILAGTLFPVDLIPVAFFLDRVKSRTFFPAAVEIKRHGVSTGIQREDGKRSEPHHARRPFCP